IEIEGGDYILTQGLKFGSTLIYQCPNGLFPYPAMTRQCSGGRWQDLPSRERNISQKCRLVECPDPTVLKYGSVDPPEERYFVGNETMYECDSGYRLRGSVKRVCLANGKWSGSTPICSRDDAGNPCPDPGIPPGSLRSGDYFDYDDEVTYSCTNSLTYLVGSRVRTCKADGQWSGVEPSCFYKYTYDTASDISEAFGGAMKQSLTESMSVEGRKITITKDGRTLNMYIAVDISDSLTKQDINESTVMVQVASYAVSPNYDILFFTSELLPISNILDYYNGVNTKTLEAVLEDLKSIQIKENRATGTDLNLVFKHMLERIIIIEETTKAKFEDLRHIILIFTDGHQNTFNSSKFVRHERKMQFYHHSVLHVVLHVVDVYIFAVGARIYESDLQPLATNERGRHFFRILKEDMDTMFDEIFDDEAVVSLCGLHKLSDITPSKSLVYPWNVRLTILRGEQTKKCTGAIVSSKLILTAAHCFLGDLPENIQVDVKQGRDQGMVEKYYRHPQYNITAKVDEGIAEFYDYDVALVQLKEDLIFTTNLKPICIPCTKETNQALRLPPDSKCSDQEKLLLKDFNQRLHFLTGEDTVKQKDVVAKLGQNRDPCINQATRLPNVTAEKIHEFVTDNFLCTGGIRPFVDHIACKGDSGGAVFRDYNQRTIQVGLVSWGTDEECKGHEGQLVNSKEYSRDFHLNLFKIVDFLHSVMAQGDRTLAPTEFIDNWKL
uniref:C3/C5 convertase n=1 Tax=Gadus morhua TaxID=8049 RepID=A0A8C5CDL5_GADMO